MKKECSAFKVLTMLLLVVVSFVFLYGCKTYEPKEEKRGFSYKTIAKGSYSGHAEKKYYVATNNLAWKVLWDQVNSTIEPKPPLPAIDFKLETIIAVFQGTQSTGGYSIEIIKVIEKKDSIEVTVQERKPKKGHFVTMAITTPYHIIKIPNRNKKIVFKTEIASNR
ncbi:protease complex subunit PrcB family protein [Candidatus Dependentiae bacterium]|nr:protease complex subunit PrcB family protein [Candidatus Dependentiae bacterium]